MKQKYLILENEDQSELIIREFAELDKDAMSLLCEETYDNKKIQSAIKKDKESLIGALRTPNMYPAGIYADRIAESVIALYESGGQEPIEVFFDDFEFVSSSRKKSPKDEVAAKATDESSDIEELIEDEFEEEFEEKPSIDNVNSTLKVDEENMNNFEEDS